MNIKFNQWIVAAGVLAASTSFASGFEKVIMFSGKYAGTGGAAASSVKGSEGVFLNPAGLANGGTEMGDVSGNFSPTFPQFSGPLIQDSVVKTSSRPMIPLMGVSAAYNVNSDMSVGLGFGSVGGSKNSFTVDPVDALPTASHMGSKEVKIDVQILEAALGIGYKIMPGLTVGAAWRVDMVSAGFSTFSSHPAALTGSPPSLTWLNLHDLKQTTYSGFRLGTQYRPNDSWGIGASYRSKIDFKVKGKANGTADIPALGKAVELTDEDASAASSLPMQLALAADFALTDTIRLFAGFDWTNYGNNNALVIEGSVQNTLSSTSTNIGSELGLGWRDMYNFRLGMEYSGVADWAIRAGYVFNTAVTNKNYARATFVAPGPGHTFLLGAGTSFMNKTLDLDGALEYGVAKASVATGEGVVGDYKTDAYAIHLGTTYRF